MQDTGNCGRLYLHITCKMPVQYLKEGGQGAKGGCWVEGPGCPKVVHLEHKYNLKTFKIFLQNDHSASPLTYLVAALGQEIVLT